MGSIEGGIGRQERPAGVLLLKPPAESGAGGSGAHRSPARLAYLMSRFPRITETFVLYEILELKKLGFEVEVYPLIREKGGARHPEVEQLGASVHYHPFLSLPVLRANWRLFRHRPAAYLRVLWRVMRSTFGSWNFLFGSLGIFPKAVYLAQEMEKAGITHLHAHFANHPAMAAFIVNQLTSIPFSFTAHGSDIHVDQRAFDVKLEAAAFAVMVSEYNKEFMIQKFGKGIEAKMRVVHCGIDPQAFAPSPRPAGKELRILCVASFRGVKGHRHLIEACRLLQERGVAFRCHLVGGGPLLRTVKDQVARSGLQDRVVFHGPLPRPQVVAQMRQADVLVLPSILDRQGRREGMPVTLMEAMASGLPVVSSRLSGIPELVESGKSGILTPPGDDRAIADALQELASSPELRLRLGQEGRRKVLEEFDLHRNTAQLAELFRAKESTVDRRKSTVDS